MAKSNKPPVTVYHLDPADREHWYDDRKGAIIARVRYAHIDLIGMKGVFRIVDSIHEVVTRTKECNTRFIKTIIGKPEGSQVVLYEAAP